MSASQELIVVPKETALTVFSADNGLEPFMAKIRAEIDAFVPDVSTKKGRDNIASIAHKVAKSKTYLDGVGKELVAELKELPKKVDASRKQMRDTLDGWKEEVRRPLTEWEQAEEDRVARHEEFVEKLKNAGSVGELSTSYTIRQSIAALEATTVDASLEEFEAEAHRVKTCILGQLRESLAIQEKREAEQAELERLRAEAIAREQQEREERIAREAAERAKHEAEQAAARIAAEVEAKAKAEREAAIRREQEAKAASDRRELELQLAAERAEREKVVAQQRAEQSARDADAKAKAAADAERARIAEEQADVERQAKAREADKAHKTKINRAALDAFMAGGLTEECAKTAVTLIAKRSIPNVSISY